MSLRHPVATQRLKMYSFKGIVMPYMYYYQINTSKKYWFQWTRTISAKTFHFGWSIFIDLQVSVRDVNGSIYRRYHDLNVLLPC